MTREFSSQINDKKLQEELKEGEKLVWAGTPERFSATSGKGKAGFTKRCIFAIVGFVVILAAYMLILGSTSGSFSVPLVVIVAIVCLYVAVLPILDARKISIKCSYYVTTDRVIEIIDAKEVFAIPLKDINVKFVPADEGCAVVLLGAAVKLPEKKYLVSTIVPVKDDKAEKAVGVTFYNVKDTKELHAALGV